LLGHVYNPVEPGVFFTQDDVQQVTNLLQRTSGSPPGPRVAFQTQTSGGEPNQWFEDRFIQLANALYRKADAQIIFVGASSEVGRIESIRKSMSASSLSAAGRTTIPELAALLSMCDLLVTLDTGTMHVGRAVKVPMVVIAHAKAPEHEWLPPASENICILRRADVDCTPCRTSACVTRECMRRIHVSEVLAAAFAHLQKFPASLAARQTRVEQSLRQATGACAAPGW
jgi:ADP-heptose:LPS heptosyltransferase